MNVFDLSGKSALVTGSTKGIGRGIAEVLASQGAQVIVSSRNQIDCDRVASTLPKANKTQTHYGMRCDITDAESLQQLMRQVTSRSGGLDILVYNAARMPTLVPFGETPDAEFLAQYNDNVVLTLRLCQLAAAQMQARGGGSMVLIGSRTGIRPAPQQLAYSCSKAAETHLARNLAMHYAPNNIRVNCIAPGLIRSDAARVVFDNPAAMAAFARDIPLGRGGEAQEIGGCVAFLVSPAGAYVTGATIPVDGGVSELPRPPGVSSPTFDPTRIPSS